MDYRLLAEFKALFEGRQYRHRHSSQGDWVAHHLYEDIYNLGKSKPFVAGVDSRERVLNVQNKRRVVKARRGDVTFGELIPNNTPIVEPGFKVALGPIANIEICVEVNILAKSMIKKIALSINE